jgi:hypothetical protein
MNCKTMQLWKNYIIYSKAILNAAQCWLDAGYHSAGNLENVVHDGVHDGVPAVHGCGRRMLCANIRVHGH